MANFERCRSAECEEPGRAKSLSRHLRLHAVPAMTHLTACTNKTHRSGTGGAERMYIRQIHNRLIAPMTGEKGSSRVLIIRVDQTELAKWTDVKDLNSARDSAADPLQEKEIQQAVRWKEKKKFHISAKPR